MNASLPNLGKAESPPGPLQIDLTETELIDWRTIDWAAVIAATPLPEMGMSNEGVSWTTATATRYTDALGDALIDPWRDYGGHDLLCLYPVLLLGHL